MSDLRLYLFECGKLKCKLHNIKMNQGLNEPYEMIKAGFEFIEYFTPLFEHQGFMASWRIAALMDSS
jgi:hypothetical protein